MWLDQLYFLKDSNNTEKYNVSRPSCTFILLCVRIKQDCVVKWTWTGLTSSIAL